MRKELYLTLYRILNIICIRIFKKKKKEKDQSFLS